MKKWNPIIIIVICMIVIAGAAYFIRPYRTAEPGPSHPAAPVSDDAQQTNGKQVWSTSDVTSVEWDGKRLSWMLRHAGEDQGEEKGKEGAWTLNGKKVSMNQVDSIMAQMNALLSRSSESSRKASSLKAEVIDSTVTLLSGPEHGDKVYQIAVEPAYPETMWIIPAGQSQVFPVPKKDILELEKNIAQFISSSPAD